MILPAGAVGDAPEFLKGPALDEWVHLTQNEHYSRLLAPAHRGALVEYCVLFGRMIDDANGLGEMTASQRQTLNSLRMQLGLTPVSSGKIAAPVESPSENPWADLKQA